MIENQLALSGGVGVNWRILHLPLNSAHLYSNRGSVLSDLQLSQKKQEIWIDDTYVCQGLPWWLRGKELPAMQETWVGSLGQEDSLKKGMASYSSILAWEIPRKEEPGGLQSSVCYITSVVSNSLQPYGLYSSRLLCPWATLYGIAKSLARFSDWTITDVPNLSVSKY